ncbi:hypothetical protein [Streptomyces sp. NPDC056660]
MYSRVPDHFSGERASGPRVVLLRDEARLGEFEQALALDAGGHAVAALL